MSEKLPHFAPPAPTARRGRHWKPASFVAFSLLSLAALHHGFKRLTCSHAPLSHPEAVERSFSWSEIEPSRTLDWHKCFDKQYDCARLDVPLNWLEPSDAQRAIIAVIRLRATDTADYRGAMIFNPGGPGGSGVWALKDHGEHLQTVVGKNHDIISFDPRGIGASVPRIECWDSPQKKQFWDNQEVPVIDAHPGVLYDAFARSIAYSVNCQTTLRDTAILEHSSTASHARDMLEILNQLGQDKLLYWGFSYGTVLGGTFAAMFPDRVGRLVSDGNVDYREWYLGEHINFIRDTDKVMKYFYETCHEAGPLNCAFYQSSPEAIEDRHWKLLDSLRVNPVLLPAGESGPEVPELVTYSKIKRLTSTTLYRPNYFFKPYAEILAALEKGDAQPYYKFVAGGRAPIDSLCLAETVPPSVPLTSGAEGTDDAFPGVLCSDGEPFTDNVTQFEEYAKKVQELSTSAGAVNVLFRISCAGRTVRPVYRFSGPFEANTSFPIMFIANHADNVTPLISARNNSAGFPGSVVLIQNSYGHTSLSAPSVCTAKQVRAYFQNATVPAPDTICQPDTAPFGLQPTIIYGGEDIEIAFATRELSRKAGSALSRWPLY